ncbi:endolytic transglycosylase MltG [Streptomyces sp. NBC_00121]|uniref:endolytic transglycosylase MltG n=1 Tax=unclassified Streptomyces TaxID=2593676 RepID=UPI0028C4D6C9|nr:MULTISPECIES: endolytic transglycosylase MltG [unclassified Streptomyces]WNO63743.1 endolytic transglycosylase MltG [Streptomyces sp. AM2-3-1]WSC68319.1 endolytic transglycosylase MltG [Streptomyces sp. NBC_01760]WTI86224.1 endolytic transglycosylase MltG [Streptomyces sp. NBC_00724]
MTEYGRGPGSEPWHPEDPLYGDQGWDGQQAAHGQSQYGPQQSYPQDPYAQQQPQQMYPQHQQHQQHQQYGSPQDPYAQDPYGQQQQPQQHDPYAQDPYGQQQQQQQQQPYDPYAQQAAPQHQQYNGGWDTGQQPAAMPPYDGHAQAQDAYGNRQGGYGASHDPYGTPEAYPPPQPPGRREAAPEQAPPRNPDWDPDEPEEETHPFFTGVDDDRDVRRPRDDDDEYDDDSRESRTGGAGERRGKGKKKSRNGCACLVVSLVLAGGLGGAGYFGYTYWQKQFGPAPDYSGQGSGSVEVEIPKLALGNEIGNILKEKGVVKSVDAFIAAQTENPKGKSIQAGVYVLKEHMSAAEAVKMMLDPKSQNLLIIPEGRTTRDVYKMVDTKLGLKAGTTKDVAKKNVGDLGLPDWADDDPAVDDRLEGFLFPAAYPVTKEMKPEAVLKKMVSRANQEYGKVDLESNAKKLGLKSPWQLITVASLVQAEGKYKHDFDKVARVVYNRLKPNNTETYGLLDFDSTVNYAKAQSTLDTGAVSNLRKFKDPYNTYYVHGLPPGPINNPGEAALHSAIKPTPGPWYYFVSVTADKTVFAVTNEEHERNRKKYEQEKSGQ